MLQMNVHIWPDLQHKIAGLQESQNDGVMRVVASSMLAVVHDRIHEQGLNAEGGQIGSYSPGYIKVRTNDFLSKTIVRGPKKGQARPVYNRTSDTKVVISLTRQMENDFKVIATDKGYGLGYSNEENVKKVGYVEATYGEKIFALTDAEIETAIGVAKDEIIKLFNQ